MNALHRYACLTAAFAFLLIVAGGLVTSTGSGLAVPDWPLSYGQLFPRMVGGILFEHGHRMVAGTVGLMTLALAAWVWIAEPRLWVRALAGAAAAGILVQALLGGLTVLLLLPPPVSIAHAVLGQTVFCLIVSLAQATSPRFADPSSRSSPAGGGRGEGDGSLWRFCAAAAAAVYLQLVLGAVLRHTGRGIVFHLLGALAAAGLTLLAVFKVLARYPRPRGLAGPAGALAALVLLQVALGVLAWLAVSPGSGLTGFWRSSLPTAHVACGAAILATAILWTLRARRLAEGAR